MYNPKSDIICSQRINSTTVLVRLLFKCDKTLSISKQDKSHIKTNDLQKVKTGTTCVPWSMAFFQWRTGLILRHLVCKMKQWNAELRAETNVARDQGVQNATVHPELHWTMLGREKGGEGTRYNPHHQETHTRLGNDKQKKCVHSI